MSATHLPVPFTRKCLYYIDIYIIILNFVAKPVYLKMIDPEILATYHQGTYFYGCGFSTHGITPK